MALRDIPPQALSLVKKFEGIADGDPSTVNLDPYADPVGIWTIGWGHAIRARTGSGFVRGESQRDLARSLYPGGITLQQAEALLHADLLDTARDVLSLVQVEINDNEYSALLSFTFNLGAANLGKSTLLKKLNAGDRQGAADQFPLWNRSGNVVLEGLTRRRIAEKIIFTS